MKQKTPEQELELLREGLLHERAIWEHINENGCNDPFWADGCNTQCCICCTKQDSCQCRCDDMDSYEYAEECEDYETD